MKFRKHTLTKMTEPQQATRSRFLDLPPELRVRIYDYALPRKHLSTLHRPDDFVLPITIGSQGCDRSPAKDFPLADTCRQVRAEALPVYFANCELSFAPWFGSGLDSCMDWVMRQDNRGLKGVRTLEVARWTAFFGENPCTDCPLKIDLENDEAPIVVACCHVDEEELAIDKVEDLGALKAEVDGWRDGPNGGRTLTRARLLRVFSILDPEPLQEEHLDQDWFTAL